VSNSGAQCYCYNCRRPIHYMGIATHRMMHRRRRELVRIRMSRGIYTYDYRDEDPS
jgi:hypothetical protein